MKHMIAATLLAAASLMAPTGASAQNKLQATIPFDFTVGENKLPAGTYVIDYVQPQAIMLRNLNKNAAVFAVLTSSEEVRKSPNKMIFNKYGDKYFLSEINGDYGQSSRRFGTSKLEKQVRVEEASRANQQKSLVAMK